MLSHVLKLKHLGPIQECVLTVSNFTVLTGPQSNGKSTVAKAVYFFRSIKQDIMNIMIQGGPKMVAGRSDARWEHTLKQRMRDKFLQLFGTSWIMPSDMEMKYWYTDKFWLRVYLTDSWDENRNFVDFEFSKDFQEYFSELDTCFFDNITMGQKKHEEDRLAKKLDDPYETVFIPAGRNLITLLSTQLNYIFTSLEELQLRNMDYITRKYTELILKLKPLFGNGMAGLLFDLENDPNQMKCYKAHRSAIHLLMENAETVLKGSYQYVDGEERLNLSNADGYVKINFASSGQQEIVWVFNLLLYYLLENRRVFLILEEPESHLYPESQQTIGEVLALFCNEKNAELLTTHSPYMLGTFNYLLLAGQVPDSKADILKKTLHKRYWISPSIAAAYHVHDGILENAMDTEDDLILIDNSLIDGASRRINEISDNIIELLDSEAGEA